MDTLEPKNLGSFSRRRFVQLAVGTLATLPVAAHEVLLEGGQSIAYAVDNDSSGTHRLVVVSPTQVGFFVADQASDANTPIPGAKVVLTSRYNGKVLTGTSDEGGIVLFDVEELSEPEREYGHCVFNGTIDITASGFREFHMSLGRIKGGLALSVPTRSLEPNRPYPSRVSFAEWDMLYTKNEFVSATGNTDSHEILVEIRELAKPCTVTLRERGSSKVYASAQLTPTAGVATASMKKPYLHKDTQDALPIEGSFYMQLDDGSTVYEFPVALGVKPSATDKFKLQPEKDYAPVNNVVPSSGQIIIPKEITGIGNQTLTPRLPIGPVVYVLDPFGFLYIAWESPRVGYINDDSTTNPGKWGVHPYTSASSQFSNYYNKALETDKSVRDMLAQGNNIRHFSFTPKIEATISLRFVAMARWSYKSGYFSGNAQAQALAHFSAGFVEQFMAGPFPLFIDFAIGIDVIYQLAGLGFATPDGLNPTKYDWDYTNTGHSLIANLSLTLSLGIGVAGVASAGIRGTLLASLFTGYTIKPDPRCLLPHDIIGLRAYIAIEVQFLFVKWSGILTDYDDPQYWDSWRDRDCKGKTPSGLFEYDNKETDPVLDFDDFRLADGSYCYEAPKGEAVSSRGSMWEIIMHESVPVTQDQMSLSSEGTIARTQNDDQPLYDYDAATLVEAGAGESFIDYLRYDRDDRFTFADGAGFSPKEGKLLPAPASPIDAKGALGINRIVEKVNGIWPKSDYKILQDVYSDPRAKIATVESPYGGTQPYLFRIGIAEVDGVQRPKLMYHRIVDGAVLPATVVNFNTGIEGLNRNNLHDYDFDVIFEGQDYGSRFCVFLMSNIDDTSGLNGAAETYDNMLFTFLTCDVSVDTWIGLEWKSFSFRAMDECTIAGGRNMFFCPRVTLLRNTRDYDLAMFSWLHRYTDSPDVPLDSPDAKLAIGMGMSDEYGVSLPKFEAALGPLADSSGYDLCANRGDDVPDARAFYVDFAVRGEKGTTCAYAIAEVPNDLSPMRVRDATQMSVEKLDGMLVPWTGNASHTGYLTSYNEKLTQVKFDHDAKRLVLTQIADFDFNAKSFCLDSTGEFIYWACGRNGVGEFDYDPQGNATPVQVTDNRIMATKIYNGTFCDPYVLSNMRHPVDQMCSFIHGPSVMGLVTTTVDDFANSLASLWYTLVPVCVCPTMLSSTLLTPLISAGTSAQFHVTIRNDGNVHITGADVALLDENGQEVSTARLTFSEETLQASVYNPPAETASGKTMTIGPNYANGVILDKPRPAVGEEAQENEPQLFSLLGAEKAYADELGGLLNVSAGYELAPGKTAVYAASLPVPADWSGEHFVSLKLKDVTYVGTAAFEEGFMQNNDGSGVLVSSFAEDPSSMQVSDEVGADHSINQDAPVTVKSKDDGGSDSSSSEESSSGKDSTDKEKTTSEKNNPTPKAGQTATASPGAKNNTGTKSAVTGDNLLLGPLGLAVGAAAAGLAAYSARRQELEGEKSDNPEEQ